MKFLKENAVYLLITSLLLNLLLLGSTIRQYNRAEENIVAERTLLWIATELHEMKANLRMPSKLMAKLLPEVGYHETGFRNIPGDGGMSHGFYQVREKTAQDILSKRKLTVEDLYNPHVNPFLAVEYLDLLYARYKNVSLTLAAYNGGLRKTDSGYVAINQVSYVNPILARYMKAKP